MKDSAQVAAISRVLKFSERVKYKGPILRDYKLGDLECCTPIIKATNRQFNLAGRSVVTLALGALV